MSSDMEDESLSEHNFYSSDSERGRSDYRHSHHSNKRREKEKRSESPDTKESTILLVKDLTTNTREEHLREIFSNYGVVKRVKLNVRDNTAISQGIAIVEMASNEEALDAIDHLDGSQIDGVKVFVTKTNVSLFDPIKKRSSSRSHSRRSRSRSHRHHSRSRSSRHHHHRSHRHH